MADGGTIMKTFPKISAWVLAVIMGAIACSGAIGLMIASRNEPMVLATAGFEFVILLTGLAGVWFALGNAREGRSIGLFNLGGVLVVAAITARFAWHVTVDSEALGVGSSVKIAFMDPWFLSRGAVGMGLVGWSVISALGSKAQAWRRLFIGTALALPFVLGVGWGMKKGMGSLFPAMVDTASGMRLIAGICLTLVFSVMFAVGVHLVIKAFETAQAGSTPGAAPDPSA